MNERIYFYRPASYTRFLLFRDYVDTSDENYISHTDADVTIKENYTDSYGCDSSDTLTFFRDFASAKAERVQAMEVFVEEANTYLTETRAMTCAINEKL